MKTSTWREIAYPTTPLSCMASGGFYFNGALHWVVTHFINQNYRKESHYIMIFNSSTHAFGTIDLPKPGWN